MDINDVPVELRDKLANLSGDEILKLAKENGVELTDDQLDAIAGGNVWGSITAKGTDCNNCGNTITWPSNQAQPSICPYCGTTFNW